MSPARRALGARLTLLGLVAGLWLACAGGAAGAEPRKLVVVADDDYPPYSFRDSSGRIQGIVPDQWAAWSRATGIEVELRALPWAEDIEAFEDGEADVLDTVFETPERKQSYEFGPAYATIEVPIFIHRSISGIASLSDLRSFRVAVKRGDAAVDRLAAEGVTFVSLYSSYEDIIEDAAALRTRIFCVDKPPALYYLYKEGIDRDFRIAFTLYEGSFHRAVRKGEGKLLSLVDDGFASLPRSTLEAIDRKWLGAPISSLVDLRLVALVGAVALLLFFGLVAIAEVLRRRVERATRELRSKVAELEANKERLRASLDEKDVLLKEVHHRVKNNMQVISSLIEFQADSYRDEGDRALVAETEARIRSMATIHELLYDSPSLGSIGGAEYLYSLAEELTASYGRASIRLDCDERLTLDLEEAVPFGLIANELISNSFKYAYPEGESGDILVELKEEGPGALFRVSDRGRGLPEGLDPERAKTMGFLLVRSLASQLGARLSFSSGQGFGAELRFPLKARAAPA